MSFNYPNASTSIINGAGFYRVKARSIDRDSVGLENELGPGDLIPIDVGFSAIAVGPESAYDKYELIYFDNSGGISVIPFSTKRPFVGDIPTNNAEEYVDGGKEKRKAFIRIVDPSTANGSLAVTAGVSRIAVVFADVIIYTKTPPTTLPTSRAPLRRSANIPTITFIPVDFFIPAYGRKILTVEGSVMKVPDVDNDVTMTVSGIRIYHPFYSDPLSSEEKMRGKAMSQATQTELLPATALPNTTPAVPKLFDPALSFGYNAEQDAKGYFDFFRVTLIGATKRPEDYPEGRGVHLNMEVRD